MAEMTLLEAAPEAHRTRARAVAGLVATGAGAIAGAIVFANGTEQLPWLAQAAALFSLAMLLISLCWFVSASMH